MARRRAVLYGRVSKALSPGEKTTSVDQQLANLLAQAGREDVEVIGPFRDDGISASRYARGKPRDGWQKTMEAILAGEVNELWTWEISRATRDRPVWVALINACMANRVLMNVGGRLHDPLDPDDGFMLDLQAALAVRESAMSSKRIKRDVAARAAEGRPHGKIPYGYTREYDTRTGKLLRQIPDPETAPILQELARRVLAGESMYAIANDLNDRGIPCPQEVRNLRAHGVRGDCLWRGDEIRDQLLSPTAAGQRVHNGNVVADATWPAIITPTQRATLLAMLTEPGRKRWFGPVKHLLTGIAECGVCGAPLRRVKNRGYPSYACRGKDGRGASCVSRLQAPLDAFVSLAIVKRMARPDVLQLLNSRDEGSDAASAARELTDLQARLAEFEASAADGGISAAAFGRIEARLLAQIEDARRRATPQEVPAVVLDLAGPDAASRWDGLPVENQRQVVRALLRVRVHRSSRGPGARGFDASAIELVWR